MGFCLRRVFLNTLSKPLAYTEAEPPKYLSFTHQHKGSSDAQKGPFFF